MRFSIPSLLCVPLLGLWGCSSKDDSASQTTIPQKFNAAYVELSATKFQSVISGKNTDLFTIKNSTGMFAKITNLGAKIEQLVVPDKDGTFGDVVLGYESIDTVSSGQASMGAFMGRYANRIGGGTFVLGGATFSVAVNEPAPKNNTLHGGAMGGRTRVYDAQQISAASVAMSLTYEDSEDADAAHGITGFPGTLQVKVVYTVTEANELKLEYSAKSLDKETVVNLTSHPFFNLGNDPNETTLTHVLQVDADRVLEINDRLLPTGVLRDVTGTAMDFRTAKPLGQDYQAPYDLLNLVGGASAGVAGGYDNTYVLNKTPGELSLAASAYEPTSGRKLSIWSTEPALQVFSGQGLIGQMPRDIGKGGVVYQKYYGFALEPMHYPDSPNQPTFPSTTLAKNDTYEGQIVFKFSVQP